MSLLSRGRRFIRQLYRRFLPSADEFSYNFSEVIYNGCLPSAAHDHLAGELIKARLLKASDRFDEALAVVNSTLDRQPEYPEALFLKAEILAEGYARYTQAIGCLNKLLALKRVRQGKDEIIRRWAQTLLKELIQQRRAERGRG